MGEFNEVLYPEVSSKQTPNELCTYCNVTPMRKLMSDFFYCARFRYQRHSGVLRHLCAPWLKKRTVLHDYAPYVVENSGDWAAPSFGPP